MIAATYTQGKGFAVRDVPRPAVGPGELLVRVKASSICGTDLRIIRSGHRKLSPAQCIVLGHEFAGVVEEAGAGVAGRFAVGTRVGIAPNIGCGECDECGRGFANMCPDYSAFGINLDGGHAAFVRVPEAAVAQGNVFSLPETVSFDEATLTEPLSCVVNSLRTVRFSEGDRLAVIGAGPVGLLHLLAAKSRGAGKVIVADIDDARLQTAKTLGADVVVRSDTEDLTSRVMSATGDRGVDVVITACAVRAVQERSLRLLAPFGRVCFFAGLPKDDPTIRVDSNLIHYRSLTLTGMTGGSNRDFVEALGLIAGGKVHVLDVVSHRFPASEMGEAFERALAGETVKVILNH